jgi:diguanylate cyclase (GGDEF)-like protein/PAS domain S-box-containing protein
MRGPVADLVLLALVVAFFGVQQRRRTEAYFRFWLWGWVLVLASMIVAQFMPGDPGARIVQQSLSRVVLACGGLAFVFSFVAKQRKGRISALQSTLVAVPIFFGLDILLTHAHARMTLIAIIVAGELVAAALTWASMNGRRGWLLWLMLAACPLSGWAMIATVMSGRTEIFIAIVPCEIFLFSGLLFSTMRRAGGRTIGAAGFFLWGLWFIVVVLPWMPAGVVAIVYALWTIPKYLVAFGMILKLFKKVNAEYAELNARHVRLYEEYRILFDSNPHPMAIYDAETTRFLAVNEAMVDSYGYSRERFLEMRIGDVSGEAMEMEGARGLPPEGMVKRVGRHDKADGGTFDVEVTGNDVKFEGRDARLVMVTDITEREELNRELIRRAHTDALTGLPNRSMLEDRLTQWLMRCIREENMGAFLTVDIDHFKRVNDTYGHQVGDECLKITAERLRSRVRQVDTIARTGGEEFTIVIGGLKTREGAEKVCGELLKLFETPVTIPEHQIHLTVSIGVALYPDDGCEVDILRRSSDQALYRAKRAGRNRAVFVPAQAPEQAVEQAST